MEAHLVKNNRMEWVDAMRGFSMIIVVLGHVLVSMGIGAYSSFLSTILLTFRMPLFFFVSGFFSYRHYTAWSKSKITDILKRKFQAQILCTLIFFSIFQLVHQDIISFHNGFGGYWFTIVLFQMYVLYLIFVGLSRVINREVTLLLLILTSVLFLGILILDRGTSRIWNILCWENLTKYMQFFTAGIIVSKYRDIFFRIIDRNWLITTVIIGYTIGMLAYYSTAFKTGYPLLYAMNHDILVRYLGLLLVIIVFYANRNSIQTDTTPNRWLKFIGRRTLDIYMLHYFFLPNMTILYPWIANDQLIIIQLMISLIISFAIVCVCLGISYIIRRSQTLEAWLFGVKIKRLV
ncbi:MAG: acyltransferase [Muribaculaceae bacterium]|nr:acyltransferase [Muribaculaceae bacterium]